MSAALLDELARLGVQVERDGDHLLVDGPEDVLTDDLLDAISAAKPGLLAALGRTSQVSTPATPNAAPVGQTASREPVGRGVGEGVDHRENGSAEMIPS